MLYRLKPLGYKGFLLGTDELGRDMLSRLIWGGRMSLMMGLAPVAVATSIGGFLGVVAGFTGGWVNMLIMRTMDVFYAFPSVLLAVAISGTMGGGVANGLVALTLVFIPPLCRVSEAATTQIRARDFVEAARASGASTLSIIFYHVLRNVMAPVFIYASSLHLGVDPAGGRALVPGAGRRAADGGLGPDAVHLAPVDLCSAPDLRAAGRSDLHRIFVLQPGQRRAAPGDGHPRMNDAARLDSARPTPVPPGDGRDRGGRAQPILIAENLRKYFPIHGGVLMRKIAAVKAVDDISFMVLKGETLGIVGESGCGKSTLARLLMCLMPRDAGSLVFDGDPIGGPSGLSLRELRRNVQIVFQDSDASLNPRLPVEDSIAYGPRVHGMRKADAKTLARDLLQRVGLQPELFGRATRTRFPAARSSASISRARLPLIRACSSWTRRSRRSTNRSRRKC